MTEQRSLSTPRVRNRLRKGVVSAVLGLWLGAPATVAADTSKGTLERLGSNVLSLAELRHAVSQQGRIIQSFCAEGTVCAVDSGRNVLAIKDSSAGVVVEVPALIGRIRPGDRVRVTGNHCALTRSRFGIQLGTAPVVNDDGHHAELTKSGIVFLEAGPQPIRVTWFNGFGPETLKVEYEGPGIQRQEIPSAALFRSLEGREARSGLEPGLAFAAYTGDWFFSLPDFGRLAPVARGIATNFDLRYSVRRENAGLVFTGYLNITNSGIYTFHVDSDDGGILYAGNPEAACQVVALGHGPPPIPRPYDVTLLNDQDSPWTRAEGEVVFMGEQDEDVVLELVAAGGERVQATIVQGAPWLSTNLLHRWVWAYGVIEPPPDAGPRMQARLTVPGPGQIDVAELPDKGNPLEPDKGSLLTSIDQIRHLTPVEASRGLRAKIKGVVIWNSHIAFVLCDASGGVYVNYVAEAWAEEPKVGQMWEIEGKTDPGNFSPVVNAHAAAFLGSAPMPDPIRPTAEQLLNGSLDAEYVELRGVLTKISPEELRLLTPEGNITLASQDDWPLPRLRSPSPSQSTILDSIVRIRGCLQARVFSSHSESEVKLRVSPATVEIEDLAPLDWFALPARKTVDLMRFDPSASLLQRTKIKGQIVYEGNGEYCLQDEGVGLRVLTKGPAQLQPGDMVEAVGFPQLGGMSLILREARVRTVARLPLPAAVQLSGNELLNRSHDSTLVQVEAVLVEDRVERGQRVLELQAGQSHFTAHLNAAGPQLDPLKAGSKVQVTGVYLSVSPEESSGNLDVFQLGLSSPLNIEVLEKPPWWTRAHAMAMVAALTAVLCLALVWISVLRQKVEDRTAQLKIQIEQRQLLEQRRAMEEERTRVAQDLHDELGAGLTEVGLLGDLVKNPAVPMAEKQRYLGQLTDTARSLVSSLDEIVWAVNPQYDSVASLASYYTLFAQRFLNLAQVACRPQIPPSFPEYSLDSKARHGLFLAFKEALNNVVRHAGASEARLKINVVEDELVISVADNGRGIGSAPETLGLDGLQNMRRRMAELGGHCEIRSRPGEGTEVELRLPIEKELPCQ